MATIDAASVKKLREMTNAGIMDCKSALTEAEGDFNRAATILREKGIASAAKKAERTTAEGSIGAFVSADGKTAALVEVLCETDFVAKNEKFQALCADLAKRAAGSDAASDAASLTSLATESGTVEQMVKEAIGTIGENIKIGRVARMSSPGAVAHYQHHDRKKAALVELSVPEGANGKPALEELGRDLCTQIVAMRPEFVKRDEIPADRLESEKNIYAQQAAAEGKPEAIQQKIAEGRLNKEFYGLVSLLDQPFVKEQKQSVEAHVKAVAKELGGDVQVLRFVRFQVGEVG